MSKTPTPKMMSSLTTRYGHLRICGFGIVIDTTKSWAEQSFNIQEPKETNTGKIPINIGTGAK